MTAKSAALRCFKHIQDSNGSQKLTRTECFSMLHRASQILTDPRTSQQGSKAAPLATDSYPGVSRNWGPSNIIRAIRAYQRHETHRINSTHQAPDAWSWWPGANSLSACPAELVQTPNSKGHTSYGTPTISEERMTPQRIGNWLLKLLIVTELMIYYDISWNRLQVWSEGP